MNFRGDDRNSCASISKCSRQGIDGEFVDDVSSSKVMASANTTKTVGIVAIQGDFASHVKALSKFSKVSAVLIKQHADLIDGATGTYKIDGLIIPGGESTTIATISKRISEPHTQSLWDALVRWVADRKPTFGTCAGLIMLADKISGGSKQGGQDILAAMPVTVTRNAYGRQAESFYSKIASKEPSLNDSAALFIRAPQISRFDKEAVQVLGTIQKDGGEEVAAIRHGPFLGTTFHAELLDGQLSWHRYFIDQVMGLHS